MLLAKLVILSAVLAPADSPVTPRQNGVLLVIGTEITEGESVPVDRVVSVMVGDETKKYRRLRIGDRVEKDQLLARLDDRLARAKLAVAKNKLNVASMTFDAAERARLEAKARYDTWSRIKENQRGGEEHRALKMLWDKTTYESDSKKEVMAHAELELKLAQTVLEMHEIRSSASGVIKAIYKRPGEAVRSLETVILIETDNK
jgi:multidrug efflux pump subunit AcrA (membrane-fusion protein)